MELASVFEHPLLAGLPVDAPERDLACAVAQVIVESRPGSGLLRSLVSQPSNRVWWHADALGLSVSEVHQVAAAAHASTVAVLRAAAARRRVDNAGEQTSLFARGAGEMPDRPDRSALMVVHDDQAERRAERRAEFERRLPEIRERLGELSAVERFVAYAYAVDMAPSLAADRARYDVADVDVGAVMSVVGRLRAAAR